LTTIDAVSDVDRAGSGALGGVPSITSNLNATYAIGKFSNTLQARYNSQIRGDATLIGPDSAGYNPALSNSINRNIFPAMVYWNYSAQYDLKTGDQSLQLFGLVNNIADKSPPSTAIVAFASGGNPYDVIGRTYKVGLRFKF
jgi:outer membrane receptor for ferrienterochelin and colicin